MCYASSFTSLYSSFTSNDLNDMEKAAVHIGYFMLTPILKRNVQRHLYNYKCVI